MTEEIETELRELPDHRREQLKRLRAELSARVNHLLSLDPQACRILGKMEILQEQLGETNNGPSVGG